MAATEVRPRIRFARFILHKNVASRRYLYKIPNPKTHKGKLKPGFVQDDVAKFARLVELNDNKESLFFHSTGDPSAKVHDVAFVTGDIDLARFIREEIRAGRLKAREDITVMPQVCPWCAMEGVEYSLPSSTEAERQKMYEHVLELHPDRVEGGLGERIEDVA